MEAGREVGTATGIAGNLSVVPRHRHSRPGLARATHRSDRSAEGAPALTGFVPYTRARGEAARCRPTWPTCWSRLGGAAASEADGVGRFVLVIPVWGDDGSRGVGAIDDDVGGRRRELRGHRPRSPKFRGTDIGPKGRRRGGISRPRHQIASTSPHHTKSLCWCAI